ncbi:hypothetical protein Pyn_38450 [Prunus yedoensis var. nudiflora]|uniref:Uncharacterized protein n=1 Tax=Prunus yedoensis var. nudiflora TaxID=2094558 RepID=A0A314UCR1_PRUYE|nr:hypothetical protein Pyn_38450 [Prunus yedoensis var. nudiflora]
MREEVESHSEVDRQDGGIRVPFGKVPKLNFLVESGGGGGSLLGPDGGIGMPFGKVPKLNFLDVPVLGPVGGTRALAAFQKFKLLWVNSPPPCEEHEAKPKSSTSTEATHEIFS